MGVTREFLQMLDGVGGTKSLGCDMAVVMMVAASVGVIWRRKNRKHRSQA